MKFTSAITELENGSLITRDVWREKGVFIWLKPATIIREEWCKDPILLQICRDNGGTISALPTICMRTEDNEVLTGWVPSAGDILANDWDFYWEVPDLKEKEMSNDYEKTASRPGFSANYDEVKRVRDAMGIGVTDEEKAAVHEKIAATNDALSANIQRDVLDVLQTWKDKADKIVGLTALKEKYMLEAKTDEDKIFVASQFETFLEYARSV